METISHRDLRNNSGSILKAVAAGESYIVTNHGEPIARIVPIADRIAVPIYRPAIKKDFTALKRYKVDQSSESILEELRADRM